MITLFRKIAYRLREYTSLKERVHTIYANQLLHPVLQGSQFLPVTSSSLSLHTLLAIANDAVVNQRKKMVEFGSGTSTIVMARLVKYNQLPLQLISIDHDPGWLQTLGEILEREGLRTYVSLVAAPMAPSAFSVAGNLWYDPAALAEADLQGADLVLVDGPYSHQQANKQARYGALPFIRPLLADRFTLVLDDTNRKGEQQVARRWEKEFGIRLVRMNDSSSYYTQGPYWNFLI
jgi:hypothetical protein